MDSKITLVADQRTIDFVFSKNSTLNANLLVNGEVRYIVSTTDRHAQNTKIIDGVTKAELVSIRKRTLFPDKITFANRQGGADQKLSDILREHKMDDGRTAHMMQTELGDFYWKMHPIHRLALFSISDPTNPVAYRDSVTSPIHTFSLVVRQEYGSLMDYIIPTFLLLEQSMRMGEKEANIADGMVSQDRTILGHYVNTGQGH